MKGTTKTTITITLTMTLEEAKALKNIIACVEDADLSPDEGQVQDDLLRTLNNLGVN